MLVPKGRCAYQWGGI